MTLSRWCGCSAAHPSATALLRNTLALTTLLARDRLRRVLAHAARACSTTPGRYGGCQVYAPGGGRRRGAPATADPAATSTASSTRSPSTAAGSSFGNEEYEGGVQPVRRHAEHAHRLVDVERPRAGAAGAAPLVRGPGHRLPGAHPVLHRGHRQPLLDRRRSAGSLCLGRRLPGRPRRHRWWEARRGSAAAKTVPGRAAPAAGRPARRACGLQAVAPH